MNRIRIAIIAFSLWIFGGTAQIFAQYPWPVTPLDQSHQITGTFCEFRDTGTSDHFHNGTDIPKADGSPVYAVADGYVTNIQPTGSNSYVRVGRYCYLHIVPAPGLQEGDRVTARQTVVGTIRPGLGHIHFIDGYYNSEINALRANGGLTPYNDPWAPKIDYVKFFQDRSDNEFKSFQLSGKVDIIVKVSEKNAPPNASISCLNNGTYKLGFQILTADGDSVIFRASGSGYQFKFDSKPSNSYVHNVFFKKYSSTSSHVYIVTNRVTSNYYWNTDIVPEGNYLVMVYAEDTRENADTVYVPVQVKEADTNPPAAPLLKYVRTSGHGFQIAWYPNTEPDLAGYYLYYSRDNVSWSKIQGTTIIPADSTTKTFKTFVTSPLYFKLTAVDNAAIPNESESSDVYGLCMTREYAKPSILIVDGFDRTSESGGAWTKSSHSFAFTYGEVFGSLLRIFDTCSNDAVLDGSVDLSEYKCVMWFVGDEGETDETLSTAEQQKLREFLDNYGALILSGANIAWNLDLDSDCYSTTESDNDFLNSILGVDFVGKIYSQNPAAGITGTIFQDVSFSLSKTELAVDSIDVISPINSGQPIIAIDSKNFIGILNENAGGGTAVFFSFPFEMIQSAKQRAEVMGLTLTFMIEPTTINDRGVKEISEKAIPAKFSLSQNFPNPFSGRTAITYHIPQQSRISIKIYNVLGQEVRTLIARNQSSSSGKIFWDGRDAFGKIVPQGIYFMVLDTGNEKISHKIIFLQ